jgi:hypothetical protein
MKQLLGDAGRAFLRAFIGALIILLPGVLSAPNLDQSYALGVAAFISSVVAGLKALTVFLPQLSFTTWVGPQIGPLLDAFVQAFIGSLVILLPGVANAPDLSTAKSLIVGVLIGALTAGVRAAQGLLTTGDQPLPATGLRTPAAPPPPVTPST